MRSIEVLAPAKINLFLKILNKRPDGYHNLETVFEKVSLFDRLVFKDTDGKGIVLRSNSKSIPLNKDNTVYKAIDLVMKKFKIKHSVMVYIEKNIPQEAGLGGGSSDAVAALKGISQLWGLILTRYDMINLSKDIGSDSPLFAFRESFLLGMGRGERLTPIKVAKDLKLWHILIVPNFGISTPKAYHLFDKYFLDRQGTGRGRKLKLTIPDYSANIINYALFNRDVSLLNYYSYNSFASFIFKDFPRLAAIKKGLEQILFDFVHVSGSGPTLFLTFSQRREAQETLERIKKRLRRDKCQFFLVHTN